MHVGQMMMKVGANKPPKIVKMLCRKQHRSKIRYKRNIENNGTWMDRNNSESESNGREAWKFNKI